VEVRTTITNTNRANYALLPVLKVQSVLGAEKIKIYKTLIRRVAS
jgi:hypothetical protein